MQLSKETELWHRTEQRGGVITHRWIRRQGCYTHLIKESGSVNLSRNSSVGSSLWAINVQGEIAMMDSFCTCFQHPHREQNKGLPCLLSLISWALGGGIFAIFSWVWGSGILDMASSSRHICSEFHSLRAPLVPHSRGFLIMPREDASTTGHQKMKDICRLATTGEPSLNCQVSRWPTGSRSYPNQALADQLPWER